jgi:CO dehydrogenase/acetyl-CoA synthase beta subunit
MGLFDKQYQEIEAFLSGKQNEGNVTELLHSHETRWPSEKNRNLVLGPDTAVELGNPRDASASFLLWVNDPSLLKNGRISLVGPDLSQLNGQQVSFGRVVIAGGTDFDAENSYERYREMELLRYDIHLKGYMIRAVSQYGREWSRVSREALEKGFSFEVLGGAIVDQYRSLSYIRAVEVIFVTAGRDDVKTLGQIGEGVLSIISAMNKMADEMSFDCDTCEYTAVCGDVAELRAMHNALQRKAAASHA